jgi:hypothetical protein
MVEVKLQYHESGGGGGGGGDSGGGSCVGHHRYNVIIILIKILNYVTYYPFALVTALPTVVCMCLCIMSVSLDQQLPVKIG